MTASGKPGSVFLGHACGQMAGPATVKLRVRTQTGGPARIDILPAGAGDPDKVISTPFEIKPGDWQDISVELKHKRRLGVLRLYLPATSTSPVELDQIDIEPQSGRAEKWPF